MLRKAFNEMNLKHFRFCSRSYGKRRKWDSRKERNLALGKSGAIILRTGNFSFNSKGLTSGYYEAFIFVRNYSLVQKLLPTQSGWVRDWDFWFMGCKGILLPHEMLATHSELKHFSCSALFGNCSVRVFLRKFAKCVTTQQHVELSPNACAEMISFESNTFEALDMF